MHGSALRFCTLLSLLLGAACRHGAGPDATDPRAATDGDTLTHVVAELRMHLRHDTYRRPRPLTEEGRDLFSAILWKLDRLQRDRGLDPGSWQNLDYVVEFARARVLEKLRSYAEAEAAYTRVAAQGSTLQRAAVEGRDGIARLAELSRAPRPSGEDELAALQERVRLWTELAWEVRGTRWEPLAREEAEAWEMLRVERLAAAGQLEAAIDAGRRLVEHHRASKLFARHLIALGDLHADGARALEVGKLTRSVHGEIDAERDALLESAFSAYELASEARAAEDRLAALARIEALRADRDGRVLHGP
jgi:hypothetical protein